MLDAQTGGNDEANDAVVRVQHDLLARSYVGVIGTLHSANRIGPNATGGFDMDFPLVVHGRNIVLYLSRYLAEVLCAIRQ